LNLDTNVTVVGIKKALLNFEQVKQITFNNTVQTYFDLENSTKNTITNLIDSKISNITNSNSSDSNQSNKLWEVGEVK
jgi:D-hexose-6-phosphate mutarotase